MARNKYPEVTVKRILDTAAELFLSKGYEKTTIQDIIDSLGDLSKGAIYYHFKSKEDIIRAVSDNFNLYAANKAKDLLKENGLTGSEKLKQFLILAMENPQQKNILTAFPNILDNPKFLSEQVRSSVSEIAPQLMEPLIRQGIEDGSIHTSYPKELAEALMLLLNIWMNPLVFQSTQEELSNKYFLLKEIFSKTGLFTDLDLLEPIENFRNIKNKCNAK